MSMITSFVDACVVVEVVQDENCDALIGVPKGLVDDGLQLISVMITLFCFSKAEVKGVGDGCWR